MLTALLILLILLFVHPFVLYPLLMKSMPARRRAAVTPEEWPPVAFVICALNEEKVIGEKLENALTMHYQPGRLTVYLVNDGSTDRTGAIARSFESRGLRVIDRPKRRGKVTNLNEVIASLEQQIVVLSDANVIYDAEAVKRLVARFSDPSVGIVTGKVVLHGTTDALRGSEEDFYSLEWMMQERESEIYSMSGTDGAMHAFRRELFHPAPTDTLIEDFVLAMSVTRQGYRSVIEPSAVARESGPQTLAEEYKRKVRIAAGAAQALIRGNGWPSAKSPASFWFIFASHKLLRWLSPVTGLLLTLVALASADSTLSQLVLCGVGAMSALAAVRWATGWSGALLDAPFYFLFNQVAVAKGLARGVLGTQSVLWEKANR